MTPHTHETSSDDMEPQAGASAPMMLERSQRLLYDCQLQHASRKGMTHSRRRLRPGIVIESRAQLCQRRDLVVDVARGLRAIQRSARSI